MTRPPASRGQNGTVLRYGRMLVEIVLVLLAAWLCVRLVFALITPVATGGGVAAPSQTAGSDALVGADLSVLERFDPFTAQALQPVDETAPVQMVAESTLNLKLRGVWSWGQSGSAIIDTGEGVETFVVGDEIQQGVVLQQVLADRVIISRNGVAEAVFLENREGARRMSDSSPARSAAPASAASQSDIARIMEMIDIRPLRDASGDGQVWQLQPGRDATAFSALGLQPGDILSQINGRRVPSEPDQLIDFVAEIANGQSVSLTVLRDGKPMTLSFTPSAKE